MGMVGIAKNQKEQSVWGPAEKGIVYAIALSALVAITPIALGVWNILQSPSSRFVFSPLNKWHILEANARCYGMLGACAKGYIVFAILWILGTAGSYFFAKRRYATAKERKQMWLAFLIAFPFANYFMGQVTFTVIFTTEAFKFGL